MSITKEDFEKLRSFVKSDPCVAVRVKVIKEANNYLRQKNTDKGMPIDVLITI